MSPQLQYLLKLLSGGIVASLMALAVAATEPPSRFELKNVFDLEYAADPQISPDGRQVLFHRMSMDIKTDRRQSSIWLVDVGGVNSRPLGDTKHRFNARWGPDGASIVYLEKQDEDSCLVRYWLSNGATRRLVRSPSGIKHPVWSPSGRWIAYCGFVERSSNYIQLPKQPKGAEWAKPPVLIRDVKYRNDGSGYRKPGNWQLFLVTADGGTPRQLTHDEHDYDRQVEWARDNGSLVFAANRTKAGDLKPHGTELFRLSLSDGKVQQLTKRDGADLRPRISPKGKQVAYLGFDDKRKGYHQTELSILDLASSSTREISGKFDRSILAAEWLDDRNLVIQYDDEGTTRLARMNVEGRIEPLTEDVGGTTIGRPYSSGSFTLANKAIAYTRTSPLRPGDVALYDMAKRDDRRLTDLNGDLLQNKDLGKLDSFYSRKTRRGQRIQAWMLRPPGFDRNKKYPLILEIHGGPYANYGRRFSAEMQLYAAAGYLVLYVNPSGSTGYGIEFADVIHHNYPGADYDDLMAVVDEITTRPYVDSDQMFVTGGSGGGVLTSWIVGKTDRFKAAVAAKPVINWYSMAFTTDIYPLMSTYWFPGPPWSHGKEYLRRSPITYVDKVTTPTMLITGEQDWRTPISESEQFYQALKLRNIDTALVRVPGTSHAIAKRPSLMMTKVAYILKWFEEHR